MNPNLLQMLQQAFAARNTGIAGQAGGQSLWAANGGRPPWGQRLSRPPGAPAGPPVSGTQGPGTGLAPPASSAPAGGDLMSLLRQMFAARPGQKPLWTQPGSGTPTSPSPPPMQTQGPGTGLAPPAGGDLIGAGMGGQVGGPNDPALKLNPPLDSAPGDFTKPSAPPRVSKPSGAWNV